MLNASSFPPASLMPRLAAAGASRTRVLTGKKMSLDTTDFGRFGVCWTVHSWSFFGGPIVQWWCGAILRC